MTADLRFDEASLGCWNEAPGETIVSSADARWTSLLLKLFRCDTQGGAFETGATADQRISVVMRGELEIAVLENGVWRQARLRPGTALMIPGGETRRMSWTSRRKAPRPEILHLFIPDQLVSAAARACRPAGEDMPPAVLLAPALSDPVVAAVGSALLKAVVRGLPDIYAESGARWLSTHLSCTRGDMGEFDELPHPGPVDDVNIARAIEYMSSHLSRPLTLDVLAREAGISKFHFTRRFKARTGETPFSHLLRLRLDAGRRMLATTDDPVDRIANACGYGRGSHFATAFAKKFGETPTDFRRRTRT